MILVNKPFYPPKEEYIDYVHQIWQSGWLTNDGPLVSELEEKLKKRLDVNHLLYVTNATIALQMAIKALDLKGEIITTPFTFVATTNSIAWEGCDPVFIDINPDSWNLDPKNIEAAITDKTVAIMATHVYGNPCDVEAIDAIAKKHNLKVIYDGAHAFDININGKSVFEYGDISVCSLHATKWFHTVQGGLLVTKDPDIHKRLIAMKNHGIADFYTFSTLGTNGRNCELHAAMGLINLKYLEGIHAKRKQLVERYNEGLKDFEYQSPIWHKDANQTYGYYPILLESEEKLIEMINSLFENGVFTRRYFFPSLSQSLPYLPKKSFKITDDIAKRVLCLPLYYDLSIEEVDKIVQIILERKTEKVQS